MDILRANLDHDQVEGAARRGTNLLVLAGPGSGKTHLLVHRAGFLLRAHAADRSRVLCLTFTTEAAKEMRRRLREVVPSSALRRAWVANFHQFGLELLRHYGHLCGVDRFAVVIDEVERSELVEEVVKALLRGNVAIASIVDFISKRKGRREYRGDLLRNIPAETLQAVVAEYERRKLERNLLDFDDLILKSVELLEQNQTLRRLVCTTFPHLMVDELQDTSLLQLTLLELLYEPGHSQIFAVADDDQLVYEWRDARPETLQEFEEHFQPEVRILRNNYRCPKRIVAVASAVIANNDGRRPKVVVPVRRESSGRVTLSQWPSREAQAAFVAAQITSGSSGPRHALKDHVILARVRKSFEPITQALQDLGIPSVEIGGRDVQSNPCVRLILAGLAYAVQQEEATVTALARACERTNTVLASDIFKLSEVVASVQGLAAGFTDRFTHCLANELQLRRILDDYGETDQVSAVDRFLAMIDLAADESQWTDYGGMLRTIRLEFGGLLQRVDASSDAVRLMTIHAAKGTQFPIVFIIDLSDTAFPNVRSRFRRPNMAEERRLLFVAITRGQEEVHLSWAKDSPYGNSGAGPSPFIDELLQSAEDDIEMVKVVDEPEQRDLLGISL